MSKAELLLEVLRFGLSAHHMDSCKAASRVAELCAPFWLCKPAQRSPTQHVVSRMVPPLD